ILIDDGMGSEDAPAWITTEYERLLETSGADFAFGDFDENAIATTFYTSGTTGDPKGVCFSHRQIVLHTLASKAPFGLTRTGGLGYDRVYMPLPPIFHLQPWDA